MRLSSEPQRDCFNTGSYSVAVQTARFAGADIVESVIHFGDDMKTVEDVHAREHFWRMTFSSMVATASEQTNRIFAARSPWIRVKNP